MKTQKERLQEYMQANKISQNGIERTLGLSTGTITHTNSELSDNIIGKIVKCIPELNIQWLLTGDGSMLRDNTAIGDGSMQNVSGSNNIVGIPAKKFESEDKWFELVAQKDAQIERMQAQIDKLLSMIR